MSGDGASVDVIRRVLAEHARLAVDPNTVAGTDDPDQDVQPEHGGRHPRHPARKDPGDVCCKWRFTMRTEDDPAYVPVELTKNPRGNETRRSD